MKRRSFLQILGGVVAAPLIAIATSKKEIPYDKIIIIHAIPGTTIGVFDSYALEQLGFNTTHREGHCLIKVPSN